MNKTITILTKETNKALVDICNNSGLPMCVLELLIKNLYNEISQLSQQQYNQELLEYNKSLKETKAVEAIESK